MGYELMSIGDREVDWDMITIDEILLIAKHNFKLNDSVDNTKNETELKPMDNHNSFIQRDITVNVTINL